MIQTQQQLSASHLKTLTLEKQRGLRTTFSEKSSFQNSIGQNSLGNSSSLAASPLQDVFFQGLRVDSPQGKLPVSKIAQNKLIDDDIYQLIRAMPKVDLHEHQSGSSDLAVLKTALISKGQMKDLDWEQLREAYRVTRDINFVKNTISSANIGEDGSVNTPPAPVDSRGSREVRRKDLESYRKTSEKINPLVKNPPFAYLSAHMFALEAVQENVRYVEYRLSPEGQGGTPEEIIVLVEEGFQDANHRLEKNRKRFDYGLIVLLTRHGDETLNPKTGNKIKVDKAIELAQKTVEMKKKGYPIVGIDLATDELHCPVTEFAPAFQVIKDYNKTCPLKDRLGITIHAGETPRSGHLEGWQSIQESVRLAWSPETAVRIGHGIQLINSSPVLKQAFVAYLAKDPDWAKKYPLEKLLASSPLLKEIIDKKICLEMCPKSNIQTSAVEGYRQHPAVFLSRLGVKVSISSDNRTISNSDNTNDFVKLYKYADANYDDRKRMVLDAMDSVFVFDPEKKQQLKQDVLSLFDVIERTPSMALARYKERRKIRYVNPLVRLAVALNCEWQDVRIAVHEFFQNFRHHVAELIQSVYHSVRGTSQNTI